jgi:PhzF family phenazine biosynthesis protein
MSTIVHIVNAFTANGSGGNPAGIVLDADNLSTAEMQAITVKVGLSDMALVCKSEQATYLVRFFTIAREIDLCGHATIAAWSLLHAQGLAAGEYTQKTHAGLLSVTITDDGLVFMQQAKATFYDEIPAVDIAPLLGITASDFHPSLKPQIVSTGIHDLFVPVKDKSVLARLQADLPAITTFSEKHQISAVHVFSLLDENDDSSIAAARNFAPVDGIDEETATGTSNGALLCYLKKHKQLSDQDTYRIEQGETMGGLSYIYGKFVEDTVWIGGMATVKDEQDVHLGVESN